MADYTNYCCRAGGSNLNAGTVDGSTTEPATTPLVTYTGGNWDAPTDVFTAAVGADMTEAVVGRFASLYHDGDSAPTTNQFLIARITAVNAGSRTITLSTTARTLLGTEVATGTGNRSLRIGGAWLGPNGATPWLSTFPSEALTNAAGNPAHVRLKNDQTYSITAVIALGSGDVQYISGYSSTYGDGGRAVIDGGTSGASYSLLNVSSSASPTRITDIEFRNNGATGSAAGVDCDSNGPTLVRCVVHDVRGTGFAGGASTRVTAIECEAYACNQSSTSALGGFVFGQASALLRCIAHDNTGSNTVGFSFGNGGLARDCIADSNGSHGFTSVSSNATPIFSGCDSYNNGSDGIRSSGSGAYAENCNLVNNTGYGANSTSGVLVLRNCAFGSGTQANDSGNTNGNVDESGSVTLTANTTPWYDPANGDFTLTTRNAGRASFLQTASSYGPTSGFAVIGAAGAGTASGSVATPLAPQGSLTTGNSKSTSTTLSTTSTITARSGQLIVLAVATDNEATADGETSLHTALTVGGHACTKAKEYTNTVGGAANDGVTTSVWYLIAPADITSGAAVVSTLNSGKDAKAIAGHVFDLDSAYSISVDGTATLANDGADPGSMSATGTLDTPHLWVRAIGIETADTTAGTLTPTAGWIAFTGTGTTGGGAATNVSVRAEFKVANGTASGTSDPTLVSADCASVLVGLAASIPGGISNSSGAIGLI